MPNGVQPFTETTCATVNPELRLLGSVSRLLPRTGKSRYLQYGHVWIVGKGQRTSCPSTHKMSEPDRATSALTAKPLKPPPPRIPKPSMSTLPNASNNEPLTSPILLNPQQPRSSDSYMPATNPKRSKPKPQNLNTVDPKP